MTTIPETNTFILSLCAIREHSHGGILSPALFHSSLNIARNFTHPPSWRFGWSGHRHSGAWIRQDVAKDGSSIRRSPTRAASRASTAQTLRCPNYARDLWSHCWGCSPGGGRESGVRSGLEWTQPRTYHADNSVAYSAVLWVRLPHASAISDWCDGCYKETRQQKAAIRDFGCGSCANSSRGTDGGRIPRSRPSEPAHLDTLGMDGLRTVS
jgi:hypothetical protein